jgi:hypothetical protein
MTTDNYIQRKQDITFKRSGNAFTGNFLQSKIILVMIETRLFIELKFAFAKYLQNTYV